MISRLADSWHTLSDVFDRADRYGGVVKSGRIVCRVVSVEAATSLNHMTLIARLLTRLNVTLCTDCGNFGNIIAAIQAHPLLDANKTF